MSCGSTSRAFVHADIYDAVIVARQKTIKRYRPGVPDRSGHHHVGHNIRFSTTRIMGFIESGTSQALFLSSAAGVRVDPRLGQGSCFIEPTIFADVDHGHALGKEEISPGALGLQMARRAECLARVQPVEYGSPLDLTNDLVRARTSAAVERAMSLDQRRLQAFPSVLRAALNNPLIGLEQCMSSLLGFTREDIHLTCAAASAGIELERYRRSPHDARRNREVSPRIAGLRAPSVLRCLHLASPVPRGKQILRGSHRV